MHASRLLSFWARRLPDRLAVRFAEREYTWAGLDRATDELAAGLYEAGLRPGDVLGILMTNRVQFVEAMHAAFRVGATVELLNIRFTAAEMVHPVTDAGTRFVVTEAAFVSVLPAVPGLTVITTEPVEGCLLLDDWRQPGHAPPARSFDPEEVALLAYTSGTTGVPKGAMLSHRAIVASGSARAVADALTWRDRVLIIIPLAFTGGTSSYLRESLTTGAPAIVQGTFDPPRILELLEREQITVCSAVPVVWEGVLALPDLARADLSALRAGVGAGAPMPIEVIRAWQRLGVGMRQGYGQTEFAGGYATLLYEDEAAEHVGSVGRVLLGHEIRVVDSADRDVPVGEAGQVLLRGPSVMSGYWKRPEATAEALAGGWLHTGDIGRLDADGFLTLVDRAKDMLISGGLNVYPAEIETVLAGRPGLEECAVVGVPHARWGEVPMLVVPDVSRVDVAELAAHVGEVLADYRRPKWIVGTGAPLPRTLGGKILKRDIRASYPEVPPDAVPLTTTRGTES
ncbi:class I adenylate-forming enzyme family protein [Pseudonocardia xishanensis]|uniref:Fatty-acid--CoA ligase FadD5 n=1 Tax=Pseudonocardia xishanensis TaxID=630995 RepID=A0ABP8RS06_9PSEU